ncbi:unnamed protein product [Allacma fusca]|uniref:Uncharacterized protein n=1 Tax=Allacma fusca TaxID=39272 RepID=A0A8J2L6T0_9HEXA|nr:unnamed protein product [Allacma fusca]
MPRDVPDRKSQLLDALSITPFPNEMPTIFALRVRSAAGTEWKSLPKKTAVDSIRSKLDLNVNVFLQSWSDRIRNFTHLLDALREYEASTEPLHSAPHDVYQHSPASPRHPVQSLHQSTSTQTITSTVATPETRQSQIPKPIKATITSRHATMGQTVHLSDTSTSQSLSDNSDYEFHSTHPQRRGVTMRRKHHKHPTRSIMKVAKPLSAPQPTPIPITLCFTHRV